MHCGSCRAPVWCATAALANPVTQTQSWTLLASWLRYGVLGSRVHPHGHFRLCNRLRSVVGEGLLAMAVVRRLRFLLCRACRAHKTGFFLKKKVCLWFLPSANPRLLLHRWVSVASYVQVDWETGTQCYVDRIAYPWTPGPYQAPRAW